MAIFFEVFSHFSKFSYTDRWILGLSMLQTSIKELSNRLKWKICGKIILDPFKNGALQKNGLERYIFCHPTMASLKYYIFTKLTRFSGIFLKNMDLFHQEYVSFYLIWKKFHSNLDVSKEVQNEKIKIEKRKKVGKIKIFMWKNVPCSLKFWENLHLMKILGCTNFEFDWKIWKYRFVIFFVFVTCPDFRDHAHMCRVFKS